MKTVILREDQNSQLWHQADEPNMAVCWRAVHATDLTHDDIVEKDALYSIIDELLQVNRILFPDNFWYTFSEFESWYLSELEAENNELIAFLYLCHDEDRVFYLVEFRTAGADADILFTADLREKSPVVSPWR